MNEQKRISQVFKWRQKTISEWRYSKFNPAHLFILQSFDREFLSSLVKNNITSFKNIKILDIGCGRGELLNIVVAAEANPKNCFGVDIIKERIEFARRSNPSIHFRCLDAQTLPYQENQFDIVIQQTTFTSILDSKIKQSVAKEMIRVLKPNGVIIWYDFFINNPKNHDTSAIGAKEIRNLFPGFKVTLRRITLAPPITRFLVNFSYILVYLLEKMKIFNTHYFGVIKKI